jgi:hypothetical protein
MPQNIQARRAFKRLLIYPSFQIKLLLANLAIMFLVATAVAFLVHQSFVNLIAQGVSAQLPAHNAYFVFMSYQEKLVMAYLAVGLGIAGVLSSVAILLLSHRVAGPIVRMSGFLTDVAQGRSAEIPELHFRKGDFFDDLPEKVNAALKARGEQGSGVPGASSRAAS